MYDLIVIGDDISSYIASTVASHYGLNTAHIAKHDIESTYSIGDYSFNLDPTPMTGFGINQTGHSLLSELNISVTEQEAFLLNPSYQVIMPEHRIDFFNDKNSLVNDLIREFPEKAPEIKAYYNAVEKNSKVFLKWMQNHPFIKLRGIKDYFSYIKLIPHLIKFKFATKKYKRTIFRNASLRKILEAQHALLSCEKDGFDSFTSHFQYSAPQRGIYNFQRGKLTLLSSLINKFQSTNGKYLNKCRLLSIKKGKLNELEVTDSKGVTSNISAKYLIISNKSEAIQILLRRKKKRINIGEWIRPTRISHYPFTLHLGILQKNIPEKMAAHVAVISDANKDIYDNNLIILELSPSKDKKKISKGQILISATVYLSDDSKLWSKKKLNENAHSIIERLEYFLPFLKENIQFIDIDKSIEISMKYRDIVNPKYQLRSSFISGFLAKNNQTRFKNIYLTGASLLMDAGFEGEIISGMYSVYEVLNKRK
ncbi:MAG: hypothetical protein A2031_07545 [Deltaproteobacteria bacterium RBG_19FT_COMBO_43_11]|nr:MAG: hypothetical protein A2031_07545 [Deltaproteobacteria bacterium RBG_19FT_COMBO_43_11]